jgi:intracellular sulfur oxidation DsrE/DsrF family protein
MFKKSLALPLALVTALSLSGITSQASAAEGVPPAKVKHAAPAKKEKLVIQVSDKDASKWNLALNNAKNVLAIVGPGKADIEIVVYGPGIGMLKLDSEVGERVDQALNDGIKIVACQNTMKGAGLTKADMLPNIGYVPAGVVEIMRKQKQGYSYVRP